MVRPKKINTFWDDFAKKDLKKIYTFNKKHFSIEFARKVGEEIYLAVENIVFLEQWQEDEILGKPYRRIVIRDYKIIYLIKNKNQVLILMIFDTRQNLTKFKLKT